MDADAGLHAPVGRPVSINGYEWWVSRWSRLFVPSLLTAADLATGHRVLDVASGTGEAAIAAISQVGEPGVVVGTDISTMMLEAARARLPASYRVVVTDGQALAFRNGSFDTVICQLGLMFFPDPARGLVEFRRVLRRGGRASVCVISTPEKAPMWGVPAETLSRHLPAQREALHLSFSLAQGPRLEEMFGAAGFREISVSRETRHGMIRSFDEYWAGIEAGTGQMPSIYSGLPEPERRDVREEVRAGLSQFEKNGRQEMSVEMLIGTGRA